MHLTYKTARVGPDREHWYAAEDAEISRLIDTGTMKAIMRTLSPDTKASATAMPVVKMLPQSIISEDAQWMTVEIKDFYLNTLLPRSEYLSIPLKFLPPAMVIMYSSRYLVACTVYPMLGESHKKPSFCTLPPINIPTNLDFMSLHQIYLQRHVFHPCRRWLRH